MGCGVSTMAAEAGTLSCHSIFYFRQNKTVITTRDKKILDVDDGNVDSSPADVSLPGKGVILVMKAKQLQEHETDEEDNGRDDGFKDTRSPSFRHYCNINGRRDDGFKGTMSLSFRDYCNITDLRHSDSLSSKRECFREDPSSRENFKSDGDDYSTKTFNKQQKEDVINFNKEYEKQERKGRGGRSRKKIKFLISWYSSNAFLNQTIRDQNKVAGKAA